MILPDAEQLLITLADKIRPLLTPDTALVGLHSGGVWLMQRLLPMLGENLASGVLDISFYRDDFSRIGLHPQTKPSQIPFEVQDRHIIIIDDVFYTGRTIRAAMNELFDYGRPASITLAVLINRGGRELPIEPQIVATNLELAPGQNLQLLRHADGRFYLQLHEDA